MGTLGKHWEVPGRQKYRDIITREVLLQATVEYKSDYKLAEELSVPVTAVQFYRQIFHIKSGRSDESLEKMRLIKLNSELVGLIVGTVLGDSSLALDERSGNGYFSVQHGEAQKEYVEYKHRKLSSLVIMPVRETILTGWGKGKKAYNFSTVWHPDLGKLHPYLYSKKLGRKFITKEALSLLTYEGLAWWFFDDGSYNSKSKQYFLATCAFSLEEQKLIREMLFRKFKIKTSIGNTKCKLDKNGKCYHYLYFAKSTMNILTNIIKNVPVKCLQYKIDRSSETYT